MTYVYRRDSMTDEARIAQLAKATEAFIKPMQGKKLSHAYVRQMSIEMEETDKTHLCPKVEGRIVKVDDKVCLPLVNYISFIPSIDFYLSTESITEFI